MVTCAIAAFVVTATRMERMGQRRDARAQVPESPILTIAVVAAAQVVCHHQQTAPMMRALVSLSGRIDVARFHRRLQTLANGMVWLPANVEGASPRATGS